MQSDYCYFTGGPKIRNPFADCNNENRKAIASKSFNIGKCISRFNAIILLHTSFQGILKVIPKLLS
jgi:hypothetical protein